MTSKSIYLLTFCALTTAATATQSLTFSDSFGPNPIAYGFANNGEASGTNDLIWGIVVDTGGNGFTSMYASDFTLNTAGIATSFSNSDDTLFSLANLTSDTTGFGGGTGSVLNMLNVDIADNQLGRQFGIIWFDSNDVSGAGSIDTGDNYGFFTHASFTIAATQGDSLDYFSPAFDTPEIRTADLAFVDNIPEPSSVSLLGLGSVALLLRRRR